MKQRSYLADRASAKFQMNVSRETFDRLDVFTNLLESWQRITNLMSDRSRSELWTRHISDCAQLVHLERQAKTWLDLGSGAGFPGLIIAIFLADIVGAAVSLVESDKRKAAFLIEAGRILALPVKVYARRIEDIVSRDFATPDVVTARALAPLDVLIRLAAPLIDKGATGLFLKGETAQTELTEELMADRFNYEIIPSQLSSLSQIVRVTNRAPGSGIRTF